jgi:hypothetical protein
VQHLLFCVVIFFKSASEKSCGGFLDSRLVAKSICVQGHLMWATSEIRTLDSNIIRGQCCDYKVITSCNYCNVWIPRGYMIRYSPASERPASKPATPSTRRNENAGQSATSALVLSEMNWRILVFHRKLLTSRNNYTVPVYKMVVNWPASSE